MLSEFSQCLRAAPQRVAYVGNSVTAQRGGYREILHSLISETTSHRHQAINVGLGGVGSFGSAALLPYFLKQRSPSVAFIETSLADSGGATPHYLIPGSLGSIVSYLRQRSAEPVFLHLPRLDVSTETNQTVRPIYDSLADEEGVSQVDVEALLRERGAPVTADLFTDGIHTTPHGANVFARTICDHLFAREHVEQSLARVQTRLRVQQRRIYTKFIESLRSPNQLLRHGVFRLQMQTVELGPGEFVEFHVAEEEVLGVVVAVDAESGVMRVASGGRDVSVQLADEWSNGAPRLQVVSFPEGFVIRDRIRVTCSDEEGAPVDAAGRNSRVIKQAKSLRIIGIVCAE